MSKYEIQNIKQAGGFTLIETIIGIFIFSIVSIGLIALITEVLGAGSKQGGVLADQDSARRVLFQIANELRNVQTGSDGSYALELAGPQELAFYAPVQGKSGIVRVRYYVQNGSLKKGITAYAGGGYATSTESSVTVQRNVNAAAGAIFSYYDGSYAGLTAQAPLSSPVNVTQVKFVKISLPIYNTAGKSNANYFTMSAGAALRGLKTNLGE